MKQGVVIGVAMTALVAVALFAYSRRDGDARREPARVRDQELAELRQEIEILKRNNNTASELGRALRNGALGRAAAIPSPSAEAAPQAPAEPSFEGQEKPPELTEEEIAVQLDNHFETESRDPAWADQATHEATRAFTEDIPAGSRVTKVECRKSLCRVDTEHDDVDAFRAFADASLLSRGRKIWNGGFSSMVRSQSESGVTAVTYIAKEGQAVPAPEPIAAVH
jgi:hypothetical protein